MLNERKKKILQIIIEDYISTAEPVGSRTIARKHDLGLSPATIRNEMSDLELLGYLEQPHTSAGRVPSPYASWGTNLKKICQWANAGPQPHRTPRRPLVHEKKPLVTGNGVLSAKTDRRTACRVPHKKSADADGLATFCGTETSRRAG